MRIQRKAITVGVALLLSFLLLFTGSVVALANGEFKPLAGVYNYVCDTTGICLEVTQIGDGYAIWGRNSNSPTRPAVVGYNGYGRNGQGMQGAAHGSSATGVVGYSSTHNGLAAIGATGSGDFGGEFRGFEGLRSIASGSNGWGVWGLAYGQSGIGSYNYASGTNGIGAYAGASGTSGHGLRAAASGSSGYGALITSSNYRGMYVNGAPGWYDAVFPDMIYVGGTVISSLGTSVVAINEGGEALEPGDLVAFARFAAAGGDGGPSLAVAKAGAANYYALVGVVQSAYMEAEAPEIAAQLQRATEGKDIAAEPVAIVGEDGALQALPMEPESKTVMDVPSEENPGLAEAGHFVEGSAQPGQQVVVMVQGITQVKADASSAPIRAGDRLVASPQGYAVKAAGAAKADGADKPREGAGESGDREAQPASAELELGRALETLDTGVGRIYIWVSIR
jgi:hypothetical protein